MAIDSRRVGEAAMKYMQLLEERYGEDAELKVLALVASVKVGEYAEGAGEYREHVVYPAVGAEDESWQLLRLLVLSRAHEAGEEGAE